MRRAALWLVAAALGLGATRAQAAEDAFLCRVMAAALLQTLNADLLSHDSATLTLERWCAAHRLAEAPQVRAVRVEAGAAASPEVRQDLGVGPGEPLRYRRVELSCGSVVLSRAENWYVPGRLTPAMNEALDGTDTPFGKAVAALHFTRHTAAAELLWHPLQDGWDMRPPPADADALAIPQEVLRHRGILTAADGQRFAEVVETYQRGLFGFAWLGGATPDGSSRSACMPRPDSAR